MVRIVLLMPRLLLPITPANTVLDDAAVAVRGADIVAVGKRGELLDRYPSARRLALDHHLLMPGLVNAHGHLAMTLLRGLGESEPLDAWLRNTIWPLEGRWVTATFVRDGTRAGHRGNARRRHHHGGGHVIISPKRRPRSPATRDFACRPRFPIIEVANAYSKDVDECFAKGIAAHDRFRNDELITACFGPHSAYAVGQKSLERVAMLANELDVDIHIHLHETEAEVADARRQHGQHVDSPVGRHGAVQRDLAGRYT